MKKIYCMILSVVLMMTLLTGCTSTTTQTKTNSKDSEVPSHINAAVLVWMEGLDPAEKWCGWTLTRCAVGETLVTVNENMEFVPQLADKWELVDETTWKFHIRQGVTFHNGNTLTPEIVKQSIERTVAANSRGSSLKIKDIKVEGENVIITTTEPFSAFLANITEPMCIIVDTTVDMSNYSTKPICTGPYMVTEYVENEKIELERYEKYWDGMAEIKTATIKNVSDDNTKAMALQSGDLNMAQGVAESSLSLFQNNPDFTVYNVTGIRQIFATLNRQNEFLADTKVRQALSYGIDRNIMASIQGTGAIPADAPLPSSVDFGYDKLTRQSYNKQKAADLLKQAGFTDSDGNGYVDKDGKELKLTVSLAGTGGYTALVESMQEQLAQIGVKIEIAMLENVSEIRDSGNFDIIMENWQTTNTNDCQKFLEGNYASGGTDNYGKYNNPDYDTVVAKLRGAFDKEERKEIAAQAQQILIDDAAALYLVAPANNLVASNRLKNLTVFPIDYYLLTNKITTKK